MIWAAGRPEEMKRSGDHCPEGRINEMEAGLLYKTRSRAVCKLKVKRKIILRPRKTDAERGRRKCKE
jgi:hypothetical protein